MKKEQIQKIVVTGLMVGAGLYLYFDTLLGSAHRQKELAKTSEEKLEPKFKEARAQIAKVAPFRERLPAAQKVVRQVERTMPAGAAVAWFPPRAIEIMAKHGIAKLKVSPTGEVPEKKVPGFRQLIWTARCDSVEFPIFLKALSEWQNADALLEVTTVQVEPNKDDFAMVDAEMSLITLVKE